jgi:hypothetical protein
MYNNQYNHSVANTVMGMVRRNLANMELQHQNIEGSGIHNTASKCPCMEMPCRCVRYSGGSGFAQGTFMDTGYEPTIGAGMSSGSKTYRKQGCGQIAAMPPPENLGEYPQVGAGRYNFPQEPIEQPLYRPQRVPAKEMTERKVGGKKGRKKGCGVKELKEDLNKFDFNRIKDYIGLAKPPAAFKNEVKKLFTQTQLERMPTKNIDKVVEKAQMNSVIGGGKSGGNLLLGAFKALGLGKSGGKKDKAECCMGCGKSSCKGCGKSGGILNFIPKVPSKILGGADSRKKRAEIVKRIMKEKGLKMIEASKYVKENNLY